MAVLLDDRTYERVKDVVRWAEDERTTVPDDQALLEKVEPVWVLTTSGTADGSGDYPGVVSLYRAYDHTWEDLTAAVRVRGIAGETLADATRYACRPAGQTTGGEDLYVLIGPASSGGSLTVYERAKYASAALETRTGVSELSIVHGYDVTTPVVTTYDTGLRIYDAEPAGKASLYLLPCQYDETGVLSSNGGAVVPGQQHLGSSKYFTNIIITAGGDIRSVRFLSTGSGGSITYPGEIGTYPDPYGSGSVGMRVRGRYNDTSTGGVEKSDGVSLTFAGAPSYGFAWFEGYNSGGGLNNPGLGITGNDGLLYTGAGGTFGTNKYLSGLFIGTSGGLTGVLG